MSYTDRAGTTYSTPDGKVAEHGTRVVIHTSSGGTGGTMVGGLVVTDKKKT